MSISHRLSAHRLSAFAALPASRVSWLASRVTVQRLRPLMATFALATFAGGCSGTAEDDDTESPTPVATPTQVPGPLDNDSDGYASDVDCNDANAAINPGKAELCDGIDQNCNTLVDEEATDALTWYADSDGDGYGNLSSVIEACEKPANASADGTDCDDAQATVNPAQSEVCGDTYDNNCDGTATPCGTAGTVYLTEATATLTGETAGDQAGQSVKIAGDINNDGFADLIIGAPYTDPSGSARGAAYVVYGPITGAESLIQADARIDGIEDNALAGLSVTGLGDVNGDEYDDIAIGVPYSDQGGRAAGMTYLFFGPLTGILTVDAANASFRGQAPNQASGYAIANAGDTDGDGVSDLLIGAPNDGTSEASLVGKAYLVLAPFAGEINLANADAVLTGEAANGQFGRAVAGVGDVNNDGKDDILIGAPTLSRSEASTGGAYLFYGPISGAINATSADGIFYGDAEDKAGSSVAGLGDMNGDGRDDFAIGAPQHSTELAYVGAVYLFHGPATGALDRDDAAATLVGETADEKMGYSLAGVGDINGDGKRDLFIGADGVARGRTSNRAAVLLYGPLAGDIVVNASSRAARILSLEANDYVGRAVAGGADLNDDDLPDLIMGVGLRDEDPSYEGNVYVFAGGPGY